MFLLALLGQEVGISVGITRLKTVGGSVVVPAPAFQLEDGSGVILLESGGRLLLE